MSQSDQVEAEEIRPRIALIVGQPSQFAAAQSLASPPRSSLRWRQWSPTDEAGLSAIELRDCVLLCIGMALSDEQAEALAAALHDHVASGHSAPRLIIHGGGEPSSPEALQTQTDYYSPRLLDAAQLSALCDSLLAQPASSHPLDAMQQHQAQRLLAQLNSCEDWLDGLCLLTRACAALLRCDSVHTLLWRHPDPLDTIVAKSLRVIQQEGGISGYCRYLGQAQRVETMAEDARWLAAVDLPDGQRSDGALLCLPVLNDTPAPAVVRCYRRDSGFSQADQGRLQALIAAVAEPLRRLWLLYAEPARLMQSFNLPALNNPVFRREALAQFVSSESDDSPVLAYNDKLTQWTYWLLLAGLISLIAYLFIGRIHDYATGPGVIRASGSSELNAQSQGTVSEVLVRPGESISQDQPLLRLYQGRELAELRQLEEEFRARLRQRLLNPDDVQVEAVLINLRSELELARSRLAERTLSAPRAGVVGDIRVRQGQYVSAGQPLLTLRHENEKRQLVALIPGRYRPQLAVGMNLRMELNGYPFDYQQLTIASIDEQVIGPQQARLFLGQAIADAISVEGPVVLVQAELPPEFSSRDGNRYAYHDGMHGLVEIRLRSEPVVQRLLPGLKAIGANDDGGQEGLSND
ncbi:MAG: hypothetical protein Tsb002_27840 [Wenzhouxiangellaceae bacterium]